MLYEIGRRKKSGWFKQKQCSGSEDRAMPVPDGDV
jgi:hypothetical protein